ncbi:hypothetical protein KW794_00480 [Candidatus Saccharibacteria bacterium]|nr:hypothetical protein [Candidatus Saccharibacteria bacterium]
MEDNQNQKPLDSQQTSELVNPTTSTIDQPGDAVNPITAPSTKRSRKPLKLVAIVLVLLVLSSVTAFAILHYAKKSPTKSSSTASALLKDRALLRYVPDAAYEKDAGGKVKTITEADGTVLNVRKKTFDVTIEKNSVQHSVSLDNKVTDFGATTDNTFYALSCEVPKEGTVGADNASFTVQFYDQVGNKLKQSKWRQQDNRSDVIGDYCNTDYFNIASYAPADFTARGYSRDAVDNLNYKVVYIKPDGSKQDVDTETAKDIDIPLGASPNSQFFLYNRVSAKQTIEGCGGEPIQLPYKVVDYSGPINELHVVDLTTNKDTMVGTEDSFADTNHGINLSSEGTFSSDSSRYYLNEGGHGGCRGGGSYPIRIAYINLKTNKLETITSPAGKEYSNYCFSDDGKYVLEYGAVDDFDDTTPPKAPSPPTILNTVDNTIYQSDKLTTAFECAAVWLPHTFTALNKTTQQDKINPSFTTDKTLLGLSSFNPATRVSQSVTFKSPIDLSGSRIDTITETSTAGISYLNRVSSGDNSTSKNLPTILFNNMTGETAEVSYAPIVL